MGMITQADKARTFLALHRAGKPLLLPNPWDLGSAKLLASMGFEALATTSSGFAATLGRNDGSVSRDEALVHAAIIVAATDVPVSADLENAYAHEPAGVAETVRLAIEVGLAGCSFAFAALGALVSAATELREQGTYGYLAASAAGRQAAIRAFG
jgi:2-methylisocitrate lyase-like PEP mutase family enzyme